MLPEQQSLVDKTLPLAMRQPVPNKQATQQRRGGGFFSIRDWFRSNPDAVIMMPDDLAKRDINELVVSIFREWHKIEDVIDSDVSGYGDLGNIWGISRDPANPSHYRHQIDAALTFVVELIDSQIQTGQGSYLNMYMGYHQMVMLGEEMSASIAYNRAKLQAADPMYYIPRTMGVRVNRIGRGRLSVQGERVERLLKDPEVKGWSKDLPTSMNNLRRERIVSPDDLKSGIQHHVKESLPRLLDFLDLPHKAGRFDSMIEGIGFTHEPDKWWKMDAFTRDGLSQMIINSGRDFYMGDSQSYAFHEALVHILNQLVLGDNIVAGITMAGHGVRRDHGRQGFASEGLAQTLPFFTPEGVLSIDKIGLLNIEMKIYQQYVLNNAYLEGHKYRFEKPEYAIEKAMNFTVQRLGTSFERDAERVFQARFGEDNEVGSAYSSIYGRAAFEHRQAVQKMTPGQKENYTKRYYGLPMTPVYSMAALGRASTPL